MKCKDPHWEQGCQFGNWDLAHLTSFMDWGECLVHYDEFKVALIIMFLPLTLTPL